MADRSRQYLLLADEDLMSLIGDGDAGRLRDFMIVTAEPLTHWPTG